MVMTAIEDVTDSASGASETTTKLEGSEVVPGETTTKTVTDTIGIAGLDNVAEEEKAEIESLVTSLLEKQLEAKFGVAQELAVTAPAAEEKAQRLVCTVVPSSNTFVFIFSFNTASGPVTVIVTVTIIRFTVVCVDDGVTPTGGTGGT
jgi:hypothetical protein